MFFFFYGNVAGNASYEVGGRAELGQAMVTECSGGPSWTPVPSTLDGSPACYLAATVGWLPLPSHYSPFHPAMLSWPKRHHADAYKATCHDSCLFTRSMIRVWHFACNRRQIFDYFSLFLSASQSAIVTKLLTSCQGCREGGSRPVGILEDRRRGLQVHGSHTYVYTDCCTRIKCNCVWFTHLRHKQ